MPFTDGVSSISGRNSRASNVSGATGASRSVRSQRPAGPANDTMASAGVLSMLKTSTDTGDIGALSFNTSRLPSVPRSTLQRRNHAARPSGSVPVSSHHNYAPSQASRVSSQWDTVSTNRRGSLTSMQSMPPSLPPAHLGKSSTAIPSQALENARDSRSFSMTSAPAAQHLPRHRSSTSLKSPGHEPRHGSHMHHGAIPPVPENRHPFVYPTRLKRPGYRSPSPALSDTYSQGSMPPVPPVPKTIPMAHPTQAFTGYGRDYGGMYAMDPRHLHVRLPPRTINTAQGYPGAYEPSPYGYQPAPMHSPPLMPMQHPGARQMQPGMQPRSPSPPAPSRSPYASPQYAPRPGHGYYAQPPQHGYHGHRGPPPPSNAAPVAHSMFHNAARMARQFPMRSNTPLTDIGPPSSEPPSSSSAPSSSNPPTPKDHSSIQVTVDPAFIDPALADLPDSSSEPVLNAKYFEYAEGLERAVDDVDLEVPHPSVPPFGFVQRVKAMLESKAVADTANRMPNENRAPQSYYAHGYEFERMPEDTSDLAEFQQLTAYQTPRVTIIEEFEAPVELPASPVKVPELEAEPVLHSNQPITQRITREMVKAELGPSSVGEISETAQLGDTDRVIVEFNQWQAKEQQSPSATFEGRRQGAVTVSINDTAATSVAERAESPDEIAGEVNLDATLPMGPNVALHFSDRGGITMDLDETHSKDCFALDADTMTCQQQEAEKPFQTSQHYPDASHRKDPQRTPDRRPRLQIVSPVHPDEEDVSKCSAVSPMQTQTLGIDETIGLTSTERESEDGRRDECSVPGSFPEESLPPPTPRMPKTHSKSVQISPSVMSSDKTSNRYSLPGDLSTMGETTMNSGSDMVTDIAVRFSLPQTTVTVSRPLVVDVSPDPTPDRLQRSDMVPTQASHLILSNSTKRHSVTFADDIAPLNITKKQDQPLSKLGNGDAYSHRTKSILPKQTSRENTVDPYRSARESTTELRFPVENNVAGAPHRFGSTHLPGLKEESIEDMSISDYKRSSDPAHFALPARIAAVKAMQERHLQESADKARARRAARHQNRPIADIRDLPSLNFSSMDLIDKLNDALEVRPRRSMEMVRRRDFSGIYCPLPQRPQSTEPLRERYMSFFNKPEDFSFLVDSALSDEETELEPNENNALVPLVHIQEHTQVEDDVSDVRGLSPQEFLTVANQVDRLSIPSVAGLSDRISELIPGLRNLSNLQLDHLLLSDHVSNHSTQTSRPETGLSSRTSAGFRTLAERAEEIVLNGTHDSIRPGSRALALNKDLPPLPESASVDRVSALTGNDDKYSRLCGSASVPADLGKDPARPSSALIRQRAPMTEEEVRQLLPKVMNPITRNNKRSSILSHPNTSRPWNLDENYPWSEGKVDVDLSVPSQAYNGASVGDVLRGRGSRSLDLTTNQGQVTETMDGIDIGSIMDERIDSCLSVTTEQLTGIPSQPGRKHSKRSIIGSLTRKFGLSGRCNISDDAADQSASKSPGTRLSHTSHRPGDRYPTSSLTPPATFNLDEVRSYFSDNSSEHNRTGSFRKRLTTFKGGSKPKAVQILGSRSHSLEDNIDTAYDAGGFHETNQRPGATSAVNTDNGVGMSKTEFHFKRFGEKLRNLWAKGGELIRTFSTRSSKPVKRPQRAQDEDWLADSLYSGV